jgi:hypothetical protein
MINTRRCNNERNPTNYTLRLKVLESKERYYFICILEYVGVRKWAAFYLSYFIKH